MNNYTMFDQDWDSLTVGDTITTDVDGVNVTVTINGMELLQVGNELHVYMPITYRNDGCEPFYTSINAQTLRTWFTKQIWTKVTR